MNQITLILYSNPKDPTKSVIPNNKKIVLEKDNLDILEDIRCQLQFETETFHLFNAGALIRVSQKTKNVIKVIYDNYHSQLPQLMQLVKYLEKFEEGEMFYYFDGERTPIVERLTAIQCLPYFPKNGFVTVIHNKFFRYYTMMGFMFKHYSFGFDDIECKVGEEDKEKRCCRFCNSTGKGNFRHIAHAIPDALGNKLLFCNEECDSCNRKLASVENNFVHMMDIRRALCKVPSKRTSKAISLYGDNFTLLADEQGFPNLYIKREMLLPKGNGVYSYRLKNSSEVTNEGMYKALVKMVIDLVPTSELVHFRNTIAWINGCQADQNLPSMFYAIRSVGEYVYLQPRLDIFFNTKEKYCDSPYCTAILYTTDIQYIFVVPFVDIDRGQFKYNGQLIEHWKRIFAMLSPRQWVEQNTSDAIPAYTWLDFDFSINDKNVHILDGTDKIFKKYKTEEEKWKLNNHQFPKFRQELIVVEEVSDVCFEKKCNRWVSQKELSDVSVNHAFGVDSYIKMDVTNDRIFVRLGYNLSNSDNTISFFNCYGMVKLEVKSMKKFIKITDKNDSSNIEVDWSFFESLVLRSAKAIEEKMKTLRIDTSFKNCSFEKAFDNEMVIRGIPLMPV